MTITARSLSIVILPVLLAAGAVGLRPANEAKGGAAAGRVTLVEGLDRDPPIVPKNRPDLAFYSARTQGESQTTVFVRREAEGSPRVVYVDAEPGELVSVSDDGARGVYRRFISSGKTVDVAVEFQKGES